MINAAPLQLLEPSPTSWMEQAIKTALASASQPTAMETALARAVKDAAERKVRDARISKAIVDMATEERARAVRTRRMIESYRDSTIGSAA